MNARSLTVLMACGLMAVTAHAREILLDLSQPVDARKKLLTAAAEGPDGTVRSHRLRSGAARVSGLAVGDVVTARLFDDKTLSVTIVEETTALSGRAFLGRIENALGAVCCVVLETERGLVLDVTDFESGRVWQVVQDDSGTIVREAKPSADRHCGSDAIPAPDGRTPVRLTATTGNGTTSDIVSSPAAVSAPEPGLPTVDILVNYDTDAANWARENGGGVEAFAETCVQKMNTALANTDLDEFFRFRLVGVYEVGGSAHGDIEQALYYACGVHEDTLNGVSWAGVRAERERLGADIVCTLCDNGRTDGMVGLGYSLKKDIDAPRCGYNACLIRSVAISHTMTHEVGHNMGAGHSDKMADADNCGPQYYDYSSGYYFYVGSKGYYTIMAYNSDGFGNFYEEVPCFSSPDYAFQGVAIGTAKNDNTRTLRQNYQMVADNLKPPEKSATATTEVPVPYSWLATYYPESRVSDYENLANANGANGCPVWHSYVAGLNPTNASSVFRAVIVIVDGRPVVSYTPELDDAAKAEREYTVLGKRRLTEDDWTVVTDDNILGFGFFKVRVRMK